MPLMLLRERDSRRAQRHSPSCAIQHIDPQGDKLNKNRYADEWDVGGLAVLAHYLYLYYSMIFRMGFIMEMTGLDKEEMEGI